jgi:hypothetical protein
LAQQAAIPGTTSPTTTSPESYPQPQPLAINTDEGWLILEDESEALIDIYIDEYGCETSEPKESVAVVARYSKPPERFGQFLLIDIRGFESMEVGDDDE